MADIITINDVAYEVRSDCRADMPLAEFLRDVVGLKGTKVMCREGGCGACVVALEISPATGEAPTTQAVHACLTPVASLLGCKVTTIEGLGNSRAGYHPIQQRLIDHHGSQCGYCSPGMVMSMYGLLKSEPRPTERQVEAAFGGNVCRCTGYRPIMDAMKSFAKDASDVTGASLIDIEDLNAKICTKTGRQCSTGHCETSVPAVTCLRSGDVTWYRPTSMGDLYKVVGDIDGGNFRFVCGNTGSAFLKSLNTYVDVSGIKSLYDVRATENYVEMGANLTLTSMMDQFRHFGDRRGFGYMASELLPHFEKIASVPLRNRGSWAGNLMFHHAMPGFPSDIIVAFRGLGAKLVVSHKEGQDEVDVGKFLELDMRGRVIECVRLPALTDSHVFRVFKVMPRAVNSHAYINGAFLFKLKDGKSARIVDECSVMFCGVQRGFTIASKVQKYLTGKELTLLSMNGALRCMSEELQPQDSRLISAAYKKNLAINSLFKFLSELSGGDQAVPVSGLQRPLGRGRQEYQVKEDKFPVTKPSNRYTGEQQAAGETQYTWDLPKVEGELQAAVVKATIGKGRLDSIDATEALNLPGVADVIFVKDIPGQKFTSMGIQVLTDDEIPFYGFPLAVVVADTEQTARRAADLVKVTYKDVETPITDIHEAIKRKYFHPTHNKPVVLGDAKGVMSTCEQVVEGEVSMGSQFHLYLENQAALCVPWEEGMRVWSATQWPSMIQASVANILGVDNNSVDAHCTKIGGGFGGKGEFSSLPACLAAIASHKLNRPVRLMFDLKTAMELTGHREAALVKYKLGLSGGVIQAVECTVYLDIGADFPPMNYAPYFVLGEFMVSLDGAYYIPNWHVEGVLVKTDHQLLAAMRAPWDMGATVIAEQLLEHAARASGRDPTDLRLTQMYESESQPLPMGFKLPCVVKLRQTWDEVMSKSNYQAMRDAAEEFNKSHKWVKHGVAVTPAKFLVLLAPMFNYPVFVSVCAGDGTVILTHGGTEIGQGIHTKAVQCAARELGVAENDIKVKVTNTIICPNALSTGGSRTSELVCRGIIDACKELNGRIRPFREKNPDADWKALIATCHGAGVDLAAHNLHIGHTAGPATYATCGCAVAGVEVDLLTGETKVNKVDMVLDVGESINPAVDIGQVEGAFVMGLGYMMTEREVFDRDTGRLLTASTWEYKVPTNWDIPREMNVYFLKDSSNPAGVLPTRAIGEPPICLSVAVLHAIKDAIWWSRQERGIQDYFTLDVPATPETIQRACVIGLDELQLRGQ